MRPPLLWFPTRADSLRHRHVTRFDPALWTVNFPRPMMAAVTTPGGDALTVDLVFYRKEDLAGLIWESEDRFDHPLLAYETRRDYRGVKLTFRWRSTGITPLDAVWGPTLTVEGRDQNGNARAWYVRLWNYASGTGTDATITLDFDNLAGGFILPDQADPVWPEDIDRLFISLVPPGYDGGASTGPLTDAAGQPSAVIGQVRITDMRVTGPHAELAIADTYAKPHGLRIANGYDDVFNLTPERVIRNMRQLGFRDLAVHYVGMSHYYRLVWTAAEGRFRIDAAAPVLNAACSAWHADYFARLAAMGFTLVLSVSFELLAQDAPWEWAQRAFDGSQALTGWSPPSTLIAPTNGEALQYVKDVFSAFGDLMQTAGLDPVFQIGEPWWWVPETGARVPHFYDAATTALWTAETGLPLPPKHQSATETPTPDQQAYLDWLGAKLGEATLALRDHITGRWPNAAVTLLFFTPQVLDASAPMLESVNYPRAHWAHPAFDFFQIEDYSHVIAGAWGAHKAALDRVTADLGYPMSAYHFFSGFARNAGEHAVWRNMATALADARGRGFGERVIWAYPQLVRDGAFFFEEQEDETVQGFHDVLFPERIGFGSSAGPRFRTEVVETVSGHERRNQLWADGRAEYDISTGIRSQADLVELLAFFRARRGRAFGFRFRDWLDNSSAATPDDPVTPFDQTIGTGDGATIAFALTKTYGTPPDAQVRRITRPVPGSVRIAIDGVEQTTGWSLDASRGIVTFTTPPPAGGAITAGFLFDVPVRFADDRLDISLEAFAAGAIPAIRLVEIREE